MKYVVCYSGGHSSAICAVEAVRRYGRENVILLNHDLCSRVEDEDIKRFKKEVADYLGIKITYANMPGVEDKDQFDVCMELNAFKYGIQSSALCTHELKTKPFQKGLTENYPSEPFSIREDIVVLYGFDEKETTRMTRRVGKMAELGYAVDFPMIWENRTIFSIEELGIARPRTYATFKHANCIGCLKSGKQHWFGVYCLYPEIWEKAKQAESSIGYSILRERDTLKILNPNLNFLSRKTLISLNIFLLKSFGLPLVNSLLTIKFHLANAHFRGERVYEIDCL